MLEWIYPPNRIQELLASAAGEESWEPDYTTLEAPRIELYLRKINGEDVQLPEYPVTTIEKFLAYKCGEDVELPEPVTRLEMLLAKDTPVEPAEMPEPQTRIEYYLLNLQAGGGVELTVTGNAPVTLANAIAHAIVSLTQEGKVTQASTPTPSSPVDIVCNNGALKLVDEDLPSGYIRVLGFQCDNNAMWKITGFKLQGADTVRISFSVNAACNVFGCYQGADAADNYDLYASVTAGSKYFRYGSGTYLSYWSAEDLGQRFDVVFTPNGSTGMPQDSTWSPATVTSANDLIIGSTTTGGTSAKLKGNLYGDIIVEQSGAERLHLIPCMKDSDGALTLGYYDIVGEAFYAPYEGYDGAMLLGLDTSHYSLQTVGTPEVLMVSGKNLNVGTLDHIGFTSTGEDSTSTTFAGTGYIFPCNSGEKYTVSFGGFTTSGISGVFINTWKPDGTFNSRQAIASTGVTTYTIPNGVGKINFTLYKTGGATIDDGAWMQVEAGDTATTYVPPVTPQTASVADLFAVGDYADEQEIISGTVTRKCGIWVLTGEENWTVASSNADVFYLPSTYFPDDYGVVASFTPICSHLSGVSSSNSIASMTAYTIKTNNSSKTLYACVGSDYTKSEWKEFIAYQYEIGTPVIIVYPLTEEVTEQVTPQSLHTAEGTNIVSVTSNVDPVQLTVVYKGTEEGE